MGGQISLMVGLMGALVAVVIGTIYGATSGYIGGRTDRVMMRILEILNAIPFMFLVIVLVTFFGRNIFLIFVAIGAIAWLDMARIVRGQTLSYVTRSLSKRPMFVVSVPATLFSAILCRMYWVSWRFTQPCLSQP